MGAERMDLAEYFRPFRENVIGNRQQFRTPYGQVDMVYADWTATGRLYRTIEDTLTRSIGPFVGNTHSESSETGQLMTRAYHAAHERIKSHVNASADDVLITYGSGMTAVVCKLQRILGLRLPEHARACMNVPERERPVVFVTHMEHHSNDISWRETCADVVCLAPGEDGLVDLNQLEHQLRRYAERTLKIGAFTACSNVTGIYAPYQDMARMMHASGGLCFVDFAASAAYQDIDMHPPDPLAKLDAVYFSPHKFLGGPGSSGVLIFDRALYRNHVPDNPGGGTVDWTSPWGHKYIDDIELREDGGTPGFLQAIRAALSVTLKEKMAPSHMLQREHELLRRLFRGLGEVPGLRILAVDQTERLGIVSFYLEGGLHYNLIVRYLSDRFGIQVRGGCSCAGTYGHYLLHVDRDLSARLTGMIDKGDQSEKPGWVRVSVHPTMTDAEVDLITVAVAEAVRTAPTWSDEYEYSARTNEWRHRRDGGGGLDVGGWFRV